MNVYQSPLKARIAKGMAAIFVLLMITTVVVSIWQDWFSKPLADIPVIFWILYGLNIISISTIFIAPKYLLQQPNKPVLPVNLLNIICFTIIGLGIGINQLVSVLTNRELKGSTVLIGTLSILLVILNGTQLLTYFRTRINKHQVSHN